MKNFYKTIKQEERGAVSALVLITVLTFLTVILGAFLTASALRKGQLRSDIRIQEIYGENLNEVDNIYENLVEKRTAINEMNTPIVNEVASPAVNEVNVNEVNSPMTNEEQSTNVIE